MTGKRSAPADGMIDTLAGLGDLRVWSVIITIFGDSVLPRGGTVAATTLAQITERMGIKPEALRVALYRLARDGWIVRSKHGRHSYYRLSPEGIAEFAPATRRIYARAPAMHGPWQLAAAEPAPQAERDALARAMTRAGHIEIAPGLYLGSAGSSTPAGADLVRLRGELDTLPDWVRARLGPAALAADYARLEEALAACRDALGTGPPPCPRAAITLRTLVIHRWRRLLLRHPDLPANFFPEGWPGERCRAHVLALHAALSPPAEAWLDEAFGPAPR
ncbi:hypothetical protein DDZ14_08715 [Maritimibacter sp. 55A14]|uniref:PaaX family transcriptional regulator n=1 Tax=Maritimibacter sp. 55A14 TaxID=2174844 RepID=UPI000D6226C7|nr:PaaX family transcriptional regulator C-terminal domain-containing protein [Maritimibacter sp. 55A14]PWE32816.1 hypothetical protein DDZ14_08715 [Maritimibacter sp. 55A14]